MCFISYKRIKGTQVKLSNGNYAIAEMVGIVHIISSIVLHDVLYLPVSYCQFDIHRQGSKGIVLFSDASCLIQITKDLKMIGLGRLHNVLYYLEDSRDVNNHAAPCTTKNGVLNKPATICITSCNLLSIPDSALCHFRFEHASLARLEAVNHFEHASLARLNMAKIHLIYGFKMVLE